MLIQVRHLDSRFDYVKDFMLQDLIESKNISQFKRASGWVTIGVDPIRKNIRDKASIFPDELREGLSAHPSH